MNTYSVFDEYGLPRADEYGNTEFSRSAAHRFARQFPGSRVRNVRPAMVIKRGPRPSITDGIKALWSAFWSLPHAPLIALFVVTVPVAVYWISVS